MTVHHSLIGKGWHKFREAALQFHTKASDKAPMTTSIPASAMSNPSFAPPRARTLRTSATLLLALAALSGCDYVGLQPVSKLEARKEAEGKAIGGACRQAGRALEDCYTFNPNMPKAAIFLGWREMNDYMMQNNLTVIRPEVAPVMPNGRARLDAPAPAVAPAKMPAKAAAL